MLSAIGAEGITCKLASLKHQRGSYNEKGEKRKM